MRRGLAGQVAARPAALARRGHDAHARRCSRTVVDDLLRWRRSRRPPLGDHRYDDLLDDLSADGRAEAARVLAGRRDALDSLDDEALDADDRVDLEVLRNGLDRRLFAARGAAPSPPGTRCVWLPGDALHPLLARDVLPAADRLRSVAARLAAVPDRLLLAERTLEDVPQVHRDTAVQQTAGVVALVRDEVGGLLAEEPSLRAEVEPAQAAAVAALERYAAWLQGQPATRDPRLGAEVFAAKLHLVLDADPAAAGRARRAGEPRPGHRGAGAARPRLGRGRPDPVRTALDRVAAEAPDDGSIVELARRSLVETAEVVRRTGLATVPDDPCEVQVMPEFRRGVAVAYCDAPGPLETGGTTFTRSARRRPTGPPSAGELLPRVQHRDGHGPHRPRGDARHVLQLAHARRHPSRVRAVLASGSFIEGWAVHAEALMVEQGHGGVPVRLQQLKMQLRMTLNALLDAGVHGGGLQEAEALELMAGAGTRRRARRSASGGGRC